jgi:hypothetical protein
VFEELSRCADVGLRRLLKELHRCFGREAIDLAVIGNPVYRAVGFEMGACGKTDGVLTIEFAVDRSLRGRILPNPVARLVAARFGLNQRICAPPYCRSDTDRR